MLTNPSKNLHFTDSVLDTKTWAFTKWISSAENTNTTQILFKQRLIPIFQTKKIEEKQNNCQSYCVYSLKNKNELQCLKIRTLSCYLLFQNKNLIKCPKILDWVAGPTCCIKHDS